MEVVEMLGCIVVFVLIDLWGKIDFGKFWGL